MGDNEASAAVQISKYSDKNILVQGDFDTYATDMKKFQARWNPRLKKGPGWLVPVALESAVREFFNSHEQESPKEQTKYRPAPSVSKKVKSPKKEERKEPPRREEAPRREEVRREEPSTAVRREETAPRRREEVRREEPPRREEVRREEYSRRREEPSPVARPKRDDDFRSSRAQPDDDYFVSAGVKMQQLPRVPPPTLQAIRAKPPSIMPPSRQLQEPSVPPTLPSTLSSRMRPETASRKPAAATINPDEEDVVSLAKRMREVMARLEQLESEKH